MRHAILDVSGGQRRARDHGNMRDTDNGEIEMAREQEEMREHRQR